MACRSRSQLHDYLNTVVGQGIAISLEKARELISRGLFKSISRSKSADGVLGHNYDTTRHLLSLPVGSTINFAAASNTVQVSKAESGVSGEMRLASAGQIRHLLSLDGKIMLPSAIQPSLTPRPTTAVADRGISPQQSSHSLSPGQSLIRRLQTSSTVTPSSASRQILAKPQDSSLKKTISVMLNSSRSSAPSTSPGVSAPAAVIINPNTRTYSQASDTKNALLSTATTIPTLPGVSKQMVAINEESTTPVTETSADAVESSADSDSTRSASEADSEVVRSGATENTVSQSPAVPTSTVTVSSGQNVLSTSQIPTTYILRESTEMPDFDVIQTCTISKTSSAVYLPSASKTCTTIYSSSIGSLPATRSLPALNSPCSSDSLPALRSAPVLSGPDTTDSLPAVSHSLTDSSVPTVNESCQALITPPEPAHTSDAMHSVPNQGGVDSTAASQIDAKAGHSGSGSPSLMGSGSPSLMKDVGVNSQSPVKSSTATPTKDLADKARPVTPDKEVSSLPSRAESKVEVTTSIDCLDNQRMEVLSPGALSTLSAISGQCYTETEILPHIVDEMSIILPATSMFNPETEGILDNNSF